MPSHSSAATFLASAVAGLTHQRLYAVVDLAVRPDALTVLTGMRQSANARCLLNTAGAEAQQAAPWLVDLGPACNVLPARLRSSVALAADTPAVTWIASSLPAEELAARLARRLDVQLSDGQTLLLRWYDPRILPELQALLRPEQRAAFNAIGSHWWWLDRAAQFERADLPGAPLHDPMSTPLLLTQQQEDRLTAASEREQFIVELTAHLPDEFHARPPLQRAAWVEAWVRQAQQCSLHSHADQLLLMCMALVYGDDFRDSDPWRAVWPQVSTGQIALRDAVSRCESACSK